MDLTREEQETVIRSNAAGKTWEVVTADPRIIRKMDKQGYYKDERRNPADYVSFTIPFDRIRILKAEKPKRSEKQLEHARKLAMDRKTDQGNVIPGDQNI